MSQTKNNIKILIDADVTIHFIEGERLDILPDIFPNRIVYIDKVADELYSFPQYKVDFHNFLSRNNFDRIKLEDSLEYVKEYSSLIKTVGSGEAACMAVAKVDKKYIASSNLRDIKEYCEKHDIKIITTMDFLWEAMNCRLMVENEIDDFIKKVKAAGSKLPVDSIQTYVEQFIMKH